MKNYFIILGMLSLLFFSSQLQGQFILNGTATQLDENCYRLTTASPNSIASIWQENQISLDNSFDFQFNMNFGCTDIGADGMVFVLQNNPNQLGQSGGDIGYGTNFIPSLAVEFDTYDNIVNADLAADHIAILRDGIVNHTNPSSLAGPVNASPTVNDIEDCNYHQVRITWNADDMLLEVFFDCEFRLSYTGDIVNNIFGGNQMVYWGFTASTGGKTNIQSICFDTIEGTTSSTNQTLSICEGEEIQLNGSLSNATYSWNPTTNLNNPNSQNPLATPSENIMYIGTATDECDNEFIDTFNIIVNTLEIEYELQPAFSDTILCNGETLDLFIQTNTNNEIVWQDGSTDNAITISQAGSYEVNISNDCATAAVINLEVENGNCSVSMPNVFTPDFDGVNDFFAPVSEGFIEIIQFKVFNRWGNIVFDENSQEGWDGTF